MNITNIVNKLYFRSRFYALERYIKESEYIQDNVLKYLISRSKETEYGRKHLFSTIKTYEEFTQNIPVNSYEELKVEIDRIRHGEHNILWPGEVKWFAKSSGTTNDKSKFIPITSRGLSSIHYQGGKDVIAIYLANNPNSKLFNGKGLILGGSYSTNYNLQNSIVGDLSSILIEKINPLVNFCRVPSKSTALLSNFEVKRERIAKETIKKNVTNISGVPSWMLSVLVKILEITGKKSINEIWPNLEVFFHGGITFTPYRKQYEHIITNPEMKYMETYNASEGFFGIQNDPSDNSMLLMIDYDVFYEFIPMDEYGNEKPNIVPLNGVKKYINYAMLITTSCGLWRYEIGDTIKFTSTNPYKFIITGRTKYYINAFGEELIMDNAEQGLDAACKATNALITDYTVAPIYMDNKGKCKHQWLIEFAKMPNSVSDFISILDTKLQEINSDYEAKRDHNITLQKLELIIARKDLFNDWLKLKGKLGGQHKIPRLLNSRKTIEELLSMNN